MGKKVICFIFYYFVIVYSFGQDMYTEKIKWEEHVESVSYVDTCDIVLAIKHGYRYKPRYYTKMLINSEYSFFCIFVSIGSGIPSWGISVYIKNDNHWNMIARGAVVRPVYALTARFSANEDKILFFTVSSGADKVSSVLKSLVEKEEEIGELSLGKFLH
ncbi:MAG: hypothetical protein J5676_04420 [Bacteroidaceae bacterium]|nr:hypothetical protein [Bacteroidaceae bacterium]